MAAAYRGGHTILPRVAERRFYGRHGAQRCWLSARAGRFEG